jgi:uracil-DNA glycosylase family 4
MKYVPGYGPLGAKVMIVGEAPTLKDVSVGRPFSDNRELDEILRECGFQKSNCWLTTVSKFYVPPSPKTKGGYKVPFYTRAKEAGIDVESQVRDLQNEVNDLKPNLIIGIGRTAMQYMTGKKDLDSYRGSIMTGMGRKFIGTYNPAHLNWQATDVEFLGYWHKVIIMLDLRRALKESYFEGFDSLPKRVLQVARSSNDLLEFKARNKDNHYVSVDIEAGGHYLPVCIGFSFKSNYGLTVPLWNRDGISNMPDGDITINWVTINEILNSKGIIGQNFNYDRDKISRLGFSIKLLKSDIMLKAQALMPEFPKGLAFNQSIRTLEPFYKNEGMYEGSYEDLFIGCARDACVTKEIDEVTEAELHSIKQDKYYKNFLMRLPKFYLDIEQQGLKVNEERRKELIRKYIHWSEDIKYQIFKIVGAEVNYNSPQQIAILLYHNWKYPDKGGTGEEALTSLLDLQTKGVSNEDHRRCIELIMLGRRVDKSIGTNLMAVTDFDGRMRTTYFPCLDTGRSSTGQQDPPIRPTVEIRDFNNKKKDKVLGAAFQTFTKHGDVGEDVRSMYVPDEEDEVFVQLDSSQAEARVIFLLANDEWALEAVDNHDFHALTASWFFGGTEENYSKKVLGYESPIRFIGKTLRHAGHLGASARRASTEVNTSARKYKINARILQKEADRALKIFHNKQPKIKGVFQNGIIAALEKDRTLFAGIPYGFDIDYGGRRLFTERWGDELFRQAFSYIPQRTISDNTKGAGIRIKERINGIKIAMESHDALLVCMKRSKLQEWIPICKQEMERPIDFSTCSLKRRQLVIPCDVEVGSNYQELSKFKDYVSLETPKIVIPEPRRDGMRVLD